VACAAHDPDLLARGTLSDLIIGSAKRLDDLAPIDASIVHSDNLLANPSFEQASDDRVDRARAWNAWGPWLNRETGWTPTRDGRAILAYHHWRIDRPESSGWWQDFATTRGGRYELIAHVNVDPGDPGSHPADRIELRLEATLDGRQITLAQRFDDIATLARADRWSRLALSARAIDDQTRVLVILHPSGDTPRGGAVKIDDLIVRPANR
jgi:hypothetical protein